MYNDVLFDGGDITNLTGVSVDRVIIDNIPQTLLSSGKLARSDGIKIFNKEYGSKTVLVEGRIMRSSRELYLETRDVLMRFLAPLERSLLIPVDGKPLEYTATCQNVIFSDVGGGFAKFTIEFICADPFGYDQGARTIINGATISSSPSIQSFSETIGGSYKTPPSIILTVSSVTGGTGGYVDLTNQYGLNIRVTRDWSADDQLVLDMRNFSCQVNGANVDFTGTFWELDPLDTLLTYSDNFTTRSVNLLVTYKRRYL